MSELSNPTPEIVQPQERSSRLVPTLYIVGGVLVLLLLGALLIWGLSALANRYALTIDVIRDLFIILLALEACVFGIVLIIMLVMLIRLVNTVEFEIRPLLEKSNQIVTTAKGTTEFVSESIIEPTVRARTYVAGVRAGFRALVADPRKNLPK